MEASLSEVDLTKTSRLRDTTDKAIAIALNTHTPEYAYFGQVTHVRLNKAALGRPSVTMKFSWDKHRRNPKRALRLTEIAIDTRTERKKLFGSCEEQHMFCHTFVDPVELSEACMDALDDMEKRQDETEATEAKRRDDAALAKLIAALLETQG
jgi:hypothetical protein